VFIFSEELASKIKELAKFSGDMLSHVIDKLPEEEKRTLNATLRTLGKSLGKTPKKENKKHQIPSANTLFLNDIVKSIKVRLHEFEARVDHHEGERIDMRINFSTDFASMSLNEILQTHGQLMQLEHDTNIFHNTIKYYRGCVYAQMRKHWDETCTLSQYYQDNLGISYSTITRYINLFNLASQYPKILVCLSFAQLQKHPRKKIENC